MIRRADGPSEPNNELNIFQKSVIKGQDPADAKEVKNIAPSSEVGEVKNAGETVASEAVTSGTNPYGNYYKYLDAATKKFGQTLKRIKMTPQDVARLTAMRENDLIPPDESGRRISA